MGNFNICGARLSTGRGDKNIVLVKCLCPTNSSQILLSFCYVSLVIILWNISYYFDPNIQ